MPNKVLFMLVFLLSVCMVGTVGAVTFEKVSSTFNVERKIHLDCPLTNNPEERDWYFTQTYHENVIWGQTAILRKDKASLVSIDSVENANADIYCYDDEGSGMDAGSPICNRVVVSTFHRPILYLWQPSHGSSYSVNMHVATDALVYYRIKGGEGENEGDEVTLRVQGSTDATNSPSGPEGTAIVQVISPAGVTGVNNIAYIPGFVINESAGGAWHNINGIRYVTVRIGDTIGMRTAVFSAMGPVENAPIKSWIREYRPCSLHASSYLNATMVPKPLMGDVDGNQAVDIRDAIRTLQVLSGLSPYQLRYDYVEAQVDVNGDGKVGLAEAIFAIQTAAELR